MKLHYTPKSHFARKVRILIDALEIDVELIDAGNVADSSLEVFVNNPLMKVPTLVDGDLVIFDSDYIAQYVVKKINPEDAFNVLIEDCHQLNARAVINGVMMAEVELIMAERTGIDVQAYTRFDKFKTTVNQGLEWLERHAEPSYADFHLICLWDHLVLYDMFTLDYPRLQSRVAQLSMVDYVAKSSPM